MSGSFSRVLDQYSYNDWAASLLVAFGETSNSTCKTTFLASNLYAGQYLPNLYTGNAKALLVCVVRLSSITDQLQRI